MSLQPTAGIKQALRRGVGSKIDCDYALGYLKTGLLLESWPMAAGKALAGWVGVAGVLCSEEEGARRLHMLVFKQVSSSALLTTLSDASLLVSSCVSALLPAAGYPALTPEHLLNAGRRFAAV